MKKDRLPPRADDRDRALYAKLRDYLVRVDDDVTCKTCQKRFEIPSHQTMVFLDERSPGRPTETMTTTTGGIAPDRGRLRNRTSIFQRVPIRLVGDDYANARLLRT